MEIKIAVAYHKYSPFIQNDCLLPMQVGKVCSDIELNMQGDDTGDNISEKNFGYAELTAIYWLWKNSKADIKGLFHYRRFLDLNLDTMHKNDDIYEVPLSENFMSTNFVNELALSKKNIMSLLQNFTILTRRKEDLRTWSNYTVRSHYAAMHHLEHLEKALDIIKKDHPSYYATAQELVQGTKSYYTNMFIMDCKHYNEYCTWMFDILFKIEKTLNLYDKTLAPNTKRARWAGFLGERLTAIYIQKQINDGQKIGEFPVAILTEKNKKWYNCNTYDAKLYSQSQKRKNVIIPNNENLKFPIASVCIAAYDVERFIEQCLTSVCNQTLQNIEIIAVNDGSKDGTLSIIKRIASKDKRIKVIDQKNKGLGSARNIGLKLSNGKYVHFLDGDDWLDDTFLERLVKNAEKNSSDLVISNHICFENGTNKELYRSTLPHTFYGCGKNIKNLPDLLLEPCHVWDKIFNKKLIKNIIFPDRSSGEDIPFWYQTLLSAKSISFVREPLYHYRMNPNSVQAKPKNVINCFHNINSVENLILKQSNLVQQYFEIFKQTLIGHLLYRSRTEFFKNKKFRKKFYSLSKNFLNKNSIHLPEEMKSKKEWYYTDFDLIDKIRNCNSFKRFERIMGVHSPQRLVGDILLYSFKKIIISSKKTNKYQVKIDEAKRNLTYPIKFKLFGITYFQIKRKSEKIIIYFLGIPLFKRNKYDIFEKFYFCGVPIISRNKIKTRFLGISVRNEIDAYLIKSFSYVDWKINNVYQKNFDDITYQLNEIIPHRLEAIDNKLNKLRKKDIQKFDYIISLGENCRTAMALRDLGLRKTSFPFDWHGVRDFSVAGEGGFSKKIDIICNNFENFFNLADYEEFFEKWETEHRLILNRRTGLQFLHEFPKDISVAEYFPSFETKYQRRIDRLYSVLNSDSSILFVFIEFFSHLSDEEITCTCRKLTKKFSNPDINFLIIKNNENIGKEKIIKRELISNVHVYEINNGFSNEQAEGFGNIGNQSLYERIILNYGTRGYFDPKSCDKLNNFKTEI